MHTTVLTLLVEKAMKGNKPSNTFKASSFATVAKAISAQFGVECYPSFVENQLAAYVENYVKYYLDSSEEEWIWMG